MKITDYAPRAAPFDSYLVGEGLVGAEVGVDVGAHAQALLGHCSVALLHLVDIWLNRWCRGYCEGRLATREDWRRRYVAHDSGSLKVAAEFHAASLGLDFVYIDQEHDFTAVADDLRVWWPLVKAGGVLGYRNYVGRGTPLDKAVDAFIAAQGAAVDVHVELGEIVLVKR